MGKNLPFQDVRLKAFDSQILQIIGQCKFVCMFVTDKWQNVQF